MLFNINDLVRVKLTQHGKDVLKKKHYEFFKKYNIPDRPYVPKKEDSKGWSEWQLWCLMSDFGGDVITIAGELLFETTIEIVEKVKPFKLPEDLFKV